MRPAVFLDRDGTIIEEKGFLSDPAGVVVLPNVTDALRLLRGAGFALVVVSNQSGIARGLFGHEEVEAVNGEIVRQLGGDGVTIDGWYWCSHRGGDGCRCRKPEPDLVHRAVDELGVSMHHGAVVGDRGSDVELGQRLGMAGVHVPGPYPYSGPEPDYRAADLLAAARWIVFGRG